MSRPQWNAFLRPNPLTAGEKDHTASVVTVGRTLRNADIARRIKDMGVPELPAGQNTLRIVTRFTAGKTLLKQPRVIEYDRPLIVN